MSKVRGLWVVIVNETETEREERATRRYRCNVFLTGEKMPKEEFKKCRFDFTG